MKTYTFNVSDGPGNCVDIVKTEEELTKQDKDLLFGNLVREWRSQPTENQHRFLDQIKVQLHLTL